MNFQKDNYYWILGLTPDTATQADIKANYRKLAMRWHPDHNPGSEEARNMFQKLTEAYDVLSDPIRKADYDKQFTLADIPTDESPFIESIIHKNIQNLDPLKKRDGGDVRFTVDVDFRTTLFGKKAQEICFKREYDCPKCNGYGSLLGRSGICKCPSCKGNGKVTKLSSNSSQHIVIHETCSVCNGKGFIIKDPCRVCSGFGRVLVDSKIPVDIPQGVNNGSIIRVTGMGHMGHLSGLNGDLYLTIKLNNDSIFHRQGQNLLLKLKVPVETLILGGEIEIPLPTGGHQKEIIPPLRPGHWTFAMNGHGIPMVLNPKKRGNLIVSLEAEFPDILNPKEHEALEHYANERRRSNKVASNEDRAQQGEEEGDNI